MMAAGPPSRAGLVPAGEGYQTSNEASAKFSLQSSCTSLSRSKPLDVPFQDEDCVRRVEPVRG